MSRRFVRLTVFTLTAVMTVTFTAGGQSAEPWLGTWTLNLTKSTYRPGPPPKSSTSTIEPWQGDVKVTVDTVPAQGPPIHLENSAKFDAKDYPVLGAPPSGTPAASNATRAYTRTHDHVEYVTKVDGDVSTTTKWTVSRDGKTLTVTITGKDALGQAIKNTQVYDKH
jgi:hypothetical protein